MTVHKEDVTVRHCEYDGTFLSEKVEHRNVYRPKSGRPYINSLGGRRYLDSDNPPTVVFKPLGPPSDCSFEAAIGQSLRNDMPEIDNGDLLRSRSTGDVYEVTLDANGDLSLSLAKCEGCGGSQEALNADDMCGSCVELDARVDQYGSEWDGP